MSRVIGNERAGGYDHAVHCSGIPVAIMVSSPMTANSYRLANKKKSQTIRHDLPIRSSARYLSAFLYIEDHEKAILPTFCVCLFLRLQQ
jgi:hypothetical protein